MQRTLLALATLTTLAALAGCASPGATADNASYDEPTAVTGSHVPRKAATSGVQSVDGDVLRAQGQVLPGRGVTGQKGQQ
jgi:hypothetical protein